MKIKKGDTVMVTTGKNRGKQAKVERVFPDLGSVLIPGANEYKKHRKSQGENRPGEILTLSRPILLSKVALICPKCKQQTRVGYKFVDSKKIRVCRKCDADIN
jgi:large subunit ribosomal protein L24